METDYQTRISVNRVAPVMLADTELIDREAVSRLHKLGPGPWRSLGKYLDYTNWDDRERFLELDRAIKLMPTSKIDFLNRRRPERLIDAMVA